MMLTKSAFNSSGFFFLHISHSYYLLSKKRKETKLKREETKKSKQNKTKDFFCSLCCVVRLF